MHERNKWLLVLMQVFLEPALKKAKASVDAAGNFQRRERMFIQRCESVVSNVSRRVWVQAGRK